MRSVKEFGFTDQLAYTFGDMAGSFVNLYYDMFFLLFCTYILEIKPGFMSALFLGARLFDAFITPLMGSLPDRKRLGNSGDKFKPYIKLFMLPLALSAILGFTNIGHWNTTYKHIWIVCVYLMYGISYTGTSIPYGAMASVITKDPVERTKLSNSRALGGMIVGAFFMGLVPRFIWNSDKTPNPSGYFIVATTFAIFSIISYFILTGLSIERYTGAPNDDESFNYKKILKATMKNRPLIGIMIASVGSLLFITGNMQFGSFVFKEYYQQPELVQYLILGQFPIMLVSMPIVPRLVAKFGKRNTVLMTLISTGIVGIFLLFVPISNPYIYIGVYLFSITGQIIFSMLVWAFVTDAIDYQEYTTKERSDGSIYSIYTFSRKIGSTLASAGLTAILAAIGFVAGIETQSPEVINSIRIIATGLPLVALVLELIGLGLIFNITQEDYDNISKELLG